MFPLRRSFAFASLALLMLAGTTRAGLVTHLTVTVKPQASEFLYSYELTNLPTSDLAAISLNLETSPKAKLHSIVGPAGWDVVYSAGDSSVAFQSSDVPYDLLPGNSYAYSFLSPLGPVLGDYVILGIDEQSSAFDFNSGRIFTPASSVPEPSTLPMLLIGLLIYIRRRNLVQDEN